LENFKEMDKFTGSYDHPKLNQKDINYLSRSITCNVIEETTVSQKRKDQDLMDSPLNSIRPLRKN
jgi:hypothetical protein